MKPRTRRGTVLMAALYVPALLCFIAAIANFWIPHLFPDWQASLTARDNVFIDVAIWPAGPVLFGLVGMLLLPGSWLEDIGFFFSLILIMGPIMWISTMPGPWAMSNDQNRARNTTELLFRYTPEALRVSEDILAAELLPWEDFRDTNGTGYAPPGPTAVLWLPSEERKPTLPVSAKRIVDAAGTDWLLPLIDAEFLETVLETKVPEGEDFPYLEEVPPVAPNAALVLVGGIELDHVAQRKDNWRTSLFSRFVEIHYVDLITNQRTILPGKINGPTPTTRTRLKPTIVVGQVNDRLIGKSPPLSRVLDHMKDVWPPFAALPVEP